MKISPFRRTGKTSRRRKVTRLKPKVRWDRLGLQEPASTATSLSMADIRREISSMMRQGLERGRGSRSHANAAPSHSEAEGRMSIRKRRRGATE